MRPALLAALLLVLPAAQAEPLETLRAFEGPVVFEAGGEGVAPCVAPPAEPRVELLLTDGPLDALQGRVAKGGSGCALTWACGGGGYADKGWAGPCLAAGLPGEFHLLLNHDGTYHLDLIFVAPTGEPLWLAGDLPMAVVGTVP